MAPKYFVTYLPSKLGEEGRLYMGEIPIEVKLNFTHADSFWTNILFRSCEMVKGLNYTWVHQFALMYIQTSSQM